MRKAIIWHISSHTMWLTIIFIPKQQRRLISAFRRSALCISLLTIIGFARSRVMKRATVDIHFNVTLNQV